MWSVDGSTMSNFHSLYCSSNIVRVIKSRRSRWVVSLDRNEKARSACKILTGKTTGKSPLGRPKREWEDNIRLHLREISYLYEELG
jgi:hypothetical protein